MNVARPLEIHSPPAHKTAANIPAMTITSTVTQSNMTPASTKTKQSEMCIGIATAGFFVAAASAQLS